MKRIVTFLALAAVLAGLASCNCGKKEKPAEDKGIAPSKTYVKPEGALRIVQYNVGVFSKEIENSIPMVAAMMQELGADAMTVNELDSCNTRHNTYQLADLAAALGGWNYYYSCAMPYREGAYGVGVTVKDKILDSFTIHLPKGEGTEPRACSVVETEKFVLASTHLDYKSMPSMVIQAKTINDALVEKYSKVSKPVFLAGDMNATPDSDVLAELGKYWKVISSTKPTIPVVEPRKCIDFVLVLNNGASVEVLGTAVPTVFEHGDVTVASDHLPVYVDVKI